ncbi:aminotransferase class I/II-fold pyridoxal phosphate-dependent enzyme [Streptococcus dentasini]
MAIKISASQRMASKQAHYTSQQQEIIRKLKGDGKKVINLGRGNPDQATFPEIVKYMQKAVQKPENQGYPPYGGKLSLKEAIIDYYKREYHVSLTSDEVTVFSGSLASLTALPMALMDPQDFALTPDPAFFAYDTGIKMAGADVYPLPLLEDNKFLPKYGDIPEDVLKRSKLMFLNYPNNPTGAGAPLSFFEETVAFAKQHNILVAHDFAYGDINFTEPAPSFLQAKGAKEIGVEVASLSKTFNMAGWRIGYAVGNKTIIALLADYIKNSVGGTFGAVQDAAEYALNHTQNQRASLRALYRKRQRLAVDFLKQHQLPVYESDGTFFLWLKLPQGVDDQEFVRELLEQEYVALIPGSVFGPSGRGYVRISLVTDSQTILEGLERVLQVYERFTTSHLSAD